jgi:hypothetical protein
VKRIRPAKVLPAIVLALSMMAACSGGGGSQGSTPGPPRPSSTAKLQILSPSNGEVFHGSSVTVPVKLSLQGARIIAATTTNISPDTGHVHLYLDNQVVAMNFSLADQVPDVGPGQHILRAEFVASDHGPFDPRVFVSVTFKVEP